MTGIVIFVASFLLGSIPIGVIVARFKGVDLRKIGSGNIGATNVGRALGKKWAVLVLLADASKGALPVLVLGRWFADPWFPALGGIAAVFGQVFSVFLGGRGGKGVATSLGAGLALAPLPALACGGIFAVLFALFRIASVGSLAAVVTFPACLYLFDLGTRPRLVFAATIAVLVIIRHKDNLVRLLNGQENRV